jgi:rare lipoprotein A
MDYSTRVLRISGLLITLTLLAACASAPSDRRGAETPPAEVDHSARYTIDQDRAPTVPLNTANVREVVPVRETRTMAGNFSPYTVNGRTYRVMATEEGYSETGYASWYGEKFHGHLTSNGEIYDMYQVSAAHTRLPIPSYVKVTNLENNRELVVRVNDRGPFHDDRIIDLSYAAAYLLGFSDQGTARVHVEALIPSLENQGYPSRQPTLAGGGGQFLQVGAFSDRSTAERALQTVKSMTTRPVFIRSVETDNARHTLHRVRVGPIADPQEVTRIKALITATELGQPLVVEE